MLVTNLTKKTTLLLLGIILLILVGYITTRLLTQDNLSIETSYKGEEESLIQTFESGILSIVNCTANPDTQNAQDFLSQLNSYRTQKGEDPLKTSPTLMRAAAWWADDMLKNKLRGHIDSLGRNPSTRAVDCGYPTKAVVENVAAGGNTNPLFSWQQSTGHNANLLDANSKVMGYAKASDGSRNTFVYIAGPIDDSDITDPIPTATPTPTSSPSPTNPQQQPTSTPTPSQGPTPTFSPTSPKIELEISFPGVGTGGNQNPIITNLPIDMQIYDTQNRKALEKTIFLTFDKDIFRGTIELNDIAPGNYYLRVKHETSLTATTDIFSVRNNQSAQIPRIQLTTGDFTNDNILDIRDYNLFISNVAICFSDICEENSKFDLDFDGKITGVDYNILLRMYSEVKGR